MTDRLSQKANVGEPGEVTSFFLIYCPVTLLDLIVQKYYALRCCYRVQGQLAIHKELVSD